MGKFENYIIDEMYDYIFQNNSSISLDFLSEFPDSFVDNTNACIYLSSPEHGNYKIKIERA